MILARHAALSAGRACWHRNAYNEHQDRKIINAFKNEPNGVRNKLVPLLTSASEEGEQFRAAIGSLHNRLENYQIHSGKGAEKERITLKNVYLRDNATTPPPITVSGYTYAVVRGGVGVPVKQMKSTVTRRNGEVAVNCVQADYDIRGLEADQPYREWINNTQRGLLRGLYLQASPRVVTDLTVGSNTPINCGAYRFTCTPEELFAGVVEVIYLMRCSFFHGELVPTREASACYEPAYLLIRKFLAAVS